MTVMGIVLLIVGALLFIASFIIPDDRSNSSKSSKAMGLKLDRMIDERVEQVKGRLSDVAVAAREEEELRAKRELERLTNEKIMAIEDYSKVVMDEIEKNHQEVMFLYDMLDNKSSDLKNTLRKADAVKKETESVFREGEDEDSTAPIKELLYSDEKEKSVSGMDRLKSAIAGLGGGGEDIVSERPASDIMPEAPAEPGAAEDSEMSRNDRVLELKKSGMDNVDIAKTLNIGVGEVNLITDLFSNEKAE
ncbi:MAG: hypothetical protein K5668_04680 [Lachnospiraceae bacterium]|nr:hypothetical protein [Lachnospiraceae bacterium]